MSDVTQRFWDKVDRSAGPDECWPWLAHTVKGGYGRFFVDGRGILAHRFAYEITFGPIPDGMTLDHVCHSHDRCRGGDTCPHRRCANPTHVEPVTQTENNDRMCNGWWWSERDTCVNGHAFTSENTRILIKPSGATVRVCRTCRRDSTQRSRERKRITCP